MHNEPQWCMGMIVTCGDGAKVACVNNNSVSVALDARAVKSPHARIFLTHSQTSRKPPIPHASRRANHTHGSQRGCKENVKSALQGLQSIPNGVTL